MNWRQLPDPHALPKPGAERLITWFECEDLEDLDESRRFLSDVPLACRRPERARSRSRERRGEEEDAQAWAVGHASHTLREKGVARRALERKQKDKELM